MTNWRYVKPLEDKNQLVETERTFGSYFGSAYVLAVIENNGGRPPVDSYNTNLTKERTIKSLLSYNKDDFGNIYKAIQIVDKIRDDVFPFATDDFGNYICFRKKDSSIVFLDFETGELEKITDSFQDFLEIIAPKEHEEDISAEVSY